MNVEIHIEELILHGFSTLEKQCIADAIQRDLAGMLATGGLSPAVMQGGALDGVDYGGEFVVPAGATGRVMGAQVAQALYSKLTR